MSIIGVITALLLFLAILIEWIGCIGVVRMRNVYDRLHAAAPANILSPIFVATAVLLSTGLSQSSIKAVLTAAVLLFTSPVITHATARAALNRRTGKQQK